MFAHDSRAFAAHQDSFKDLFPLSANDEPTWSYAYILGQEYLLWVSTARFRNETKKAKRRGGQQGTAAQPGVIVQGSVHRAMCVRISKISETSQLVKAAVRSGDWMRWPRKVKLSQNSHCVACYGASAEQNWQSCSRASCSQRSHFSRLLFAVPKAPQIPRSHVSECFWNVFTKVKATEWRNASSVDSTGPTL